MANTNKKPEDYVVRFTTGGRINSIEDWLNQNAVGKWTIKIDGLFDDLRKKDYVLVFEREEDRNAFRTYYRIPKPRARRAPESTTKKLTRQVGSVVGQLKSKIKMPGMFQQSET
jgi:hypothetical protein